MAAQDSTYFEVYVGSTKEEVHAKISPEDAQLVLKYRWVIRGHTKYGKWVKYACTDIRRNGVRKTYKMHRLILNAEDGMHVDHINGDGLDNRRENLRLVTPQQNQANSRKRSKMTSRFKGVCWHAAARKWRATLAINHRSLHLGLFDDEILAAQAYDEKAREMFGEFAHLNLS